MEIKLVIDGSDMRVRLTPKHGSDRKLLDFINEMDIARIVRAQDYSVGALNRLKYIDLKLEIEPLEEGVREVDYPRTSTD